jgi:MoaA/NifB/PqqE/SkfB family radical SAM enzyme
MELKHHAAKINPHFILVMVFCAMKRNIDQLMDYVILAHRLGAKVIQVNYLLVVKEHSGLEQEAMCFHPNDYNIAISSAKNKASQLGLTLNHQPMFNDQNFDKSTPCFKPWSNLAISRDGSISVCCGGSPVAGNIFETDFFTLWNNEKFQLFRKTVNSPNPPAICTSCTRGRENPWRIATHLTYMRGWTKSQIEDRLKTLGIEIPTKLVLT